MTIGDETLIQPMMLTAEANNNFLFSTYKYSFVKNRDGEISGLLGAYFNKFSANLSGTASGRNSNGTTTLNTTVAYQPLVTVPIPLIGASIDWKNDNLLLYAAVKF